jgi:DNA-directed RNA polymerase subunit M/transcription elongation factor TFIIS
MEFCSVCNNKMYLLEEEDKLYLQCKVCGKKKKNKKNIIITKIYKQYGVKNNVVDNKYIIYDNTLPRTNIKDCPNVECKSHSNIKLKEAIYFPDVETRIVNYVCCLCYTKWKCA